MKKVSGLFHNRPKGTTEIKDNKTDKNGTGLFKKPSDQKPNDPDARDANGKLLSYGTMDVQPKSPRQK